MLDLHIHSTVSDGSDAPEEAARLAVEAGCTGFALTDHDRLDGVDRAAAVARDAGAVFVPGCELSCDVDRGSLHVLVYGVEPGDGALQAELVRLQDARERRNRVMCERLGLSYDDLLAEAGGSGAGRPHAAALLVKQGRATSIDDAFARFVGRGTPGDVQKERLTTARAMELARQSGGVAVLAHPLSLELPPNELAARVRELRDLGLRGLECEYSRYSPDERAALRGLAADLGLLVTGGSDYHGTYKPDLSVGTGAGDLDVPDALLEPLLDAIGG